MLDKLLESYAPFISAMDKEWLDYTSANIRDTIYHITRYLKIDPLKILHARLNTSNMAHSNKRRQIESTLTLTLLHHLCQLAKSLFVYPRNLDIQLINVGNFILSFA